MILISMLAGLIASAIGYVCSKKEKADKVLLITAYVLIMGIAIGWDITDFGSIKSERYKEHKIILDDSNSIKEFSFLGGKGLYEQNGANTAVIKKLQDEKDKYLDSFSDSKVYHMYDTATINVKVKDSVGVLDNFVAFGTSDFYDVSIKIEPTTQKAEFKGVKLTREICEDKKVYSVGDLKLNCNTSRLSEYDGTGYIDLTIAYGEPTDKSKVISDYTILEAKQSK